MNLDLSPEAREYGQFALQALEAAGGNTIVERAEAEPERRAELVEPVLAELGAWELEPRADADQLEAAAALCRSAGYWSVAYPVAERLSKPTDLDVDGLIVVGDRQPAAAVAGLSLKWAAVALDGTRSFAVPRPTEVNGRANAFVAPLELEAINQNGTDDLALALTLPCWTLLGMLDRAMELAREHVLVREQFGQTLSKFQNVQFTMADAEVDRAGLDTLAKYALWSVQTHRSEAVDDALALRAAAIEAATNIFRTSHQLHGALGFCDEAPLSWVSRHSVPLRQLPFGLSLVRELLADRIAKTGLTGLFSDGGAR